MIGCPAPSGYIENTTLVTEGSVNIAEKRQRDLRNKGTRKSAVGLWIQKWQGSYTGDTSTVQLPKQDLYKDNVQRHDDTKRGHFTGPRPQIENLKDGHLFF